MINNCVQGSVSSEVEHLRSNCGHCHGDDLCGVYNVKNKCGECHNQGKAESQPASSYHGPKNYISKTPSCFACHSKVKLP